MCDAILDPRVFLLLFALSRDEVTVSRRVTLCRHSFLAGLLYEQVFSKAALPDSH
jgi:hypothetical protein